MFRTSILIGYINDDSRLCWVMYTLWVELRRSTTHIKIQLMSQASQNAKQTDFTTLFVDQMDQIIKKKSVVISASKFPIGISLETICERLDILLETMQPSLCLEQVHILEFRIQSLPLEVYLLLTPSLRVLDLRNNQLIFFPTNLGACSKLESLNLSFNSIKFIQLKDLLKLSSLRKLLLIDNKLSILPPALGDMTNLETLDIIGNPLVLPPTDFRDNYKTNIRELQTYLVSNRSILDQQIENLTQSLSRSAPPSTPSFVRTRSVSDTRMKSSKASKRMGLIINSSKGTPENAFMAPGQASIESATPSKPERKLLLPGDGRFEVHGGNEENGIISETDNTKRSQNSFTAITTPKLSDGVFQFKDAEIVRNRANTLKNEILAVQAELLDSETKLSTFPRRLSTLQERPLDEFSRAHTDYKFNEKNKIDDLKSPMRGSVYDSSPSKSTKKPPNNTSENALNFHNTQNVLINSYFTYNAPNFTQVVKTIIHSLKDIYKSLVLLTKESKFLLMLEMPLQLYYEEMTSLQMKVDLFLSGEDNQVFLVNILTGAIASIKTLISNLNENLKLLIKSQTYCLRTIYLSLFGAIAEMNNAYKLIVNGSSSLKSHSTQQSSIKSGQLVSNNQPEASKNPLQAHTKENIGDGYSPEVSSSEIDGRLLIAVDCSTADALVVLRELTNTMNALVNSGSKNPQSISPALATKCKDLHNVCSATMEKTRMLISNLSSFQLQKTLSAKRLLWDDINAYLKAVLTIFAAVKGIMNDAPVLNDARQSMANLTKSTKEVTILLEASSFKSSSELQTSTLSANLSLLGISQLLLSTSMTHTSSANLQQLNNSSSSTRTPSVSMHGTGVGPNFSQNLLQDSL